MRAINLFTRTMAVAAALLTLSSCLNKETELSPLSQPTQLAYEATTSEVLLYWAPVEGAGQYYYRLENEHHIAVSRGVVSTTSVTISGLKPASTYTALVKAIPSGETYKENDTSEYASLEVRTETPVVRQYEWVFDNAEVFFGDNQNFYSTKARFGLEKGTGYYVVEAYCGVEGFDLEFTTDEKGFVHPTRTSSIFMKEDPNWDGAVYLAHGLGGTTYEYVVFFDNYKDGYNNFTGNETGGIAYYWCFDPNNEWTYWQVTYGNYTPPEPPPVIPDADAEESWSKDGTAFFDGEELGSVSISFNAETGLYTIDNWYGEQGHGIAFTRNAETGKWIMDTDKSSAYIDGPYEGTGLYELSHGKYGKGMSSTLLLDPSDSGYDGDGENGDVWSKVTDPSGKTGYYEVRWVTDLSPFRWACDIYVNGVKLDGTGVISYDGEGTYTLESWYGVPGYDLVFTLDNGWILDTEKSTAIIPDTYVDGYCHLAHGLSGTAKDYCEFWGGSLGYGWLDGNSKEGNAGFWHINASGDWCEYRIVWKEGNWSTEGTVYVWGGEVPDYTELGTATLSYDITSDKYTISNWFGAEGQSIVFSLVDGAWLLDWENSPSAQGAPDDNQCVSILHGRTDGSQANCWYWMNGNYSWFEGNAVSGNTGCWLRDHNNHWTAYTFAW